MTPHLLMVVNTAKEQAERLGFSGSTARARILGKYFLNQGLDLKILTTVEGAKFFRANGIETGFLTTTAIKGRILPIVYYILNFMSSTKYLFRRERIDVIYSTSDLLPDVLFSMMFKLLNKGTLFICGCHSLVRKLGDATRPSVRSRIHHFYSYHSQQLFLSMLRLKANKILVSNNVDREVLISKGFKEVQVATAYGAPEREFVDKVLSEKHVKRYDILFLGNEHPIKGLDTLDYIFSRLVKTDLRIAVVGLLPKLEERYGNEKNFIFFGILTGLDKYRTIGQSKIFIMSSYHESFSLTTCEALGCGVPIVAFDTKIFRSIYKKGVVFIPYADKEAMYNEIVSLLRDEVRLGALSQEAAVFGNTFSWDNTGKQILDYINSKTN